MRYLLCSVLVFLYTGPAYSASKPAASTPPASQNAVDIVLLEATITCGWGERFYVQKGKYSEPEVHALTTLLDFRFSDRDIFAIQFEQRSPTPVSTGQMDKQLADSAFRTLIGPLLEERVRALGKERTWLEESRGILPRDPEEFMRHPQVEAYEQAGARLMDALLVRFPFSVQENGVDCN